MARVTGCRSSVDRSPALTLAVPRRRFHPPSSFRGFTSVHPPPKLLVGFFSSLLKACTSSPKTEMSLSLLPAAGGAAPGPERPGARVDTHKGPSRGPQDRASSEGETRRRQAEEARREDRGSRHQAPPPPHTADSRAPQCPSRVPAPGARGTGGPTSTSSPSSSAATLPSRRPMAPARTVRSRAVPRDGREGGLRGIRADAGRRTRGKPAELEDVPGRPRRALPTHLTGARSWARSPQSLWSALRDAETPGLGEKTSWCLLSRKRPSCLTLIVLGRFLKDAGFGAGGWIRMDPSPGLLKLGEVGGPFRPRTVKPPRKDSWLQKVGIGLCQHLSA